MLTLESTGQGNSSPHHPTFEYKAGRTTRPSAARHGTAAMETPPGLRGGQLISALTT